MKADDEDLERLSDPDAGEERASLVDAANAAGHPPVQIGHLTVSGPAGWADAINGASDVLRIALAAALRLHASGYRDTDDDAADARAFVFESEGGGVEVGGVAADVVADEEEDA
jgi:hypothetical protein